MFFETEYRYLDGTEWFETDKNAASTEFIMILPSSGVFVFRMRSLSDAEDSVGVPGPWSEESAPI
eukprot:4590853-Prymnesium_polylepis.1